MLQLVKVFWDICRLKVGPQKVPKGTYLLASIVFAGIIVDSFTSSIFIPALSGFDVVKIVTIYDVLLLASIYLLLKLVSFEERGIQAVTAIAGSGLFISLVLLPSLLMLNSAEEEVKSFAIYILVDTVWRVAVNAHIFRHAFSINLLLAMVVSMSYLVFGLYVGDFLLPAQNQ